MKSEYDEKIIVKYPPCKQPEQSCIDYDYDPCESSDDITEKDLAILLKEENRLRAEKEAAEAERLRREQELLRGKKGFTESGKSSKKCKKAIKNPFFSNRLEFSTCLPPRPPTPPPQFYPTYDEDEGKKCTKRKKKCKKKKDEFEGDMEGLESEPEEEEEEECEEEETETEDIPRHRRKCKKIYRPPCRKRSSEISNPLQPRQIPARQRDLPQTSPLEMPEVERQIWLSSKNDCETNHAKNNCKSCLKKKCKRKWYSSENRSND